MNDVRISSIAWRSASKTAFGLGIGAGFALGLGLAMGFTARKSIVRAERAFGGEFGVEFAAFEMAACVLMASSRDKEAIRRINTYTQVRDTTGHGASCCTRDFGVLVVYSATTRRKEKNHEESTNIETRVTYA